MPTKSGRTGSISSAGATSATTTPRRSATRPAAITPTSMPTWNQHTFTNAAPWLMPASVTMTTACVVVRP